MHQATVIQVLTGELSFVDQKFKKHHRIAIRNSVTEEKVVADGDFDEAICVRPRIHLTNSRLRLLALRLLSLSATLRFARLDGTSTAERCNEESMKLRRILTFAFSLWVALALTTPAHASSFTFGPSGSLSATATFTTAGNQLTVVLTNTGGDVLVPADVMTALFFNCTGCGTLTPVSATSLGDTFLGTTDLAAEPAGSNVGGEWGYLAGLAGAPGGATMGISSSGLSPLFGGANFNGSNLSGPTALDGLQYGVVSSSDDPSTGNGGVTGNELTHNGVRFVLTSNLADITGATFSNTSVQYGTSLEEPNLPGSSSGGGSGQTLTPEPTSLLLFGTGLAMTAYRTRRKKS